MRSAAANVLRGNDSGRYTLPSRTTYGVRSLDAARPERSPRNYWRGPVWANVTWLTALGLRLHGEERAALALREKMLGAIEGGAMREYFVPESGRGLGAHDFAWTAALCLRELRPT